MIKIQRLTEKDLDIFREKKVIIVGEISYLIRVYNIFKLFNIDVVACCDENKNKYTDKDLPLVKSTELTKIISRYGNKIIFQCIKDSDKNNLSKYKNVIISKLFAEEIILSFSHLILFDTLSSKMKMYFEKLILLNYENIIHTRSIKKFASKKHSNSIFICSPTKTGDFSLLYTFEWLNKNSNAKLNPFNFWHRPALFNEKYISKNCKNIKIIVGLRDPISQNLSELYQKFANYMPMHRLVLTEWDASPEKDVYSIIDKYKNCYKDRYIDVQEFWNIINETFYINNQKDKREKFHRLGMIQLFVPVFQKHIIDFTKYPFDKEKGYTIIKEGNIEVFVYQLEKLNNLVPELSEWVGVPFTELVRGNDASDKWISDSYKQAQKEIEITQEYFDRCYNEPYVQHCYSQEDIEKFKARWRPHIKN